MEDVKTATKRAISTFVKCRRQRLWELIATSLCHTIQSYIVLDKIAIGHDFYTNRAFKEKALSLGFVEEPTTTKERDNSILAMCRVGAIATNVIERYALSLAIYSNRLNKERSEEAKRTGIPMSELADEEEDKKLLSFITETYTNEEVDTFEKAVLTTYEELICSLQLATIQGIEDTSTNDYLTRMRECIKTKVEAPAEFLMLSALQEIAEAEETGKPQPYTDGQAAFVVNYVKLKYPEE